MAKGKRRLISQKYGSYHVTSRTAGGYFLFGDEEKEYFVKLLERFARGFFVKIHAFCILDNHFHLLVTCLEHEGRTVADQEILRRYRLMFGEGAEPPVGSIKSNGSVTPDPDGGDARLRWRLGTLAGFVRELKLTFSRWYNLRTGRKGTLWSDRYNSVVVDHSHAWLMVKSYIDLNSIRANIVKKPEDYRWSSIGLSARNYKRASRFLHPGQYEEENEQTYNPFWYREFIYRSGGVAVEGKSSIPMEIVQEVIKFHGKLGIGDRLSYRLRNISEGIAIGSREFIRTIQEEGERKFIRPRIVIENSVLFATRVLSNRPPTP